MRLATDKDIEELSQLRILQQKDDWQEEFEDKYNLLNVTREYLKAHLNKDIYMFIEEDADIIATCGIHIINYLPQCNDNEKKGYICNVYTKKEYRNRGIQTRLLKECIKFAKEENICYIDLFTNKEASSFYKKIGFEFDDLIMKLDVRDN